MSQKKLLKTGSASESRIYLRKQGPDPDPTHKNKQDQIRRPAPLFFVYLSKEKTHGFKMADFSSGDPDPGVKT